MHKYTKRYPNKAYKRAQASLFSVLHILVEFGIDMPSSIGDYMLRVSWSTGKEKAFFIETPTEEQD